MSSISEITSTIDKAIEKLSKSAGAKQQSLYDKLLNLVKSLETNGDNLVNNIANLKKINEIKVQLERFIIDDKYKRDVKEFVETYNSISDLTNQYFANFNSKFTPKETFKIIRRTAIDATINGLLETGVQASVSEPIRKMLVENTSKGGSYSELVNGLKTAVMSDGENLGLLQNHVEAFGTTAINQYSREYGKAISDDLGLEWFVYSGSLLVTSRPFCIKCVELKYIHISQFDELLKGHIGMKGEVPIAKSTGLPSGLMKGTDKENLVRRAGGWRCPHKMIAVNEIIVPQNYKDYVFATSAYKTWKAGKK